MPERKPDNATCPDCAGTQWRPEHVTLTPDGRVLGLGYPLTCTGCDLVRTMPIGDYPTATEETLRDRVERGQRLASVPRNRPGRNGGGE